VADAHDDVERVPQRRRIALVAHDNKKPDLLDWARYNREVLAAHDLVATGTTGRLLAEHLDLDVTRLRSGPLGGDQQLGALITEGRVDLLVFFWDPLEPQPHDPDVRALLRIAVVWNTAVACNRATADFLISSPLLEAPYEALVPDYDGDSGQLVTAGRARRPPPPADRDTHDRRPPPRRAAAPPP
jgi:methylglyoxal synthase